MKYLTLLLALSFGAHANVYKCEVNGTITYSQVPCGDDAEVTDYKNTPSARSNYQPFVASAYAVEYNEKLADEAKEKIRALLKDPASAVFSELVTTFAPDNRNKVGICGNVNAKNSYGGYTGTKPFAVIDGEPRIWDEALYLSGIDLNGSLKRQCYLKSNKN